MKKLLVLSTLFIMICSACSSDDDTTVPENNETKIIGLWVSENTSRANYYKATWNFEEDKSGVFTETEIPNDPEPFTANFTWSEADEVFTVVYENPSEDGASFSVTISDIADDTVLLDSDEVIFAIKQ